jgi:hypothetical protein
MAEPERRRRRLRPPSSSAAPAAVPASGVETAATPAGAPMTEQPRPPMSEPARPPMSEPARPMSEPARPPMSEQARPPRTPPVRRPTSGAGTGAPAGGGPDDRDAERGLRGLVGSGSSQVSVGAAMRARDAARPSAEQFADADANLTIVRRNWQPREELPKR